MQSEIYKMEFPDIVEILSVKHNVNYGQLYDYMKLNLGPRIFIQYPKILFDKARFEQLRINITEHELRNGYLQQRGYKLERIVSQEVSKYTKAQ